MKFALLECILYSVGNIVQLHNLYTVIFLNLLTSNVEGSQDVFIEGQTF